MWNPNIYQRPGVYWEEISNVGISTLLPEYPLTIVGVCPSSTNITESLAISSTAQELSHTVVEEDSIIVTSVTGNVVYELDTDYVITPATEEENTKISLWSNGPENLNASISMSGGSLPAGTYSYVISAVSENGLETTAVSTENYLEEVVVSANNSIISLSWDAVSGASYYRIYRGGTGETPTLLAQINATSTSYDDNGSSSPNGITTPPSEHKCLVSYDYTQKDRYEPKIWYDVDDIESFYGPATDSNTGGIVNSLSFAAKLAAYNGCQYIQTLAISEDSVLEWRNALEKLKTLDSLELIVPLTFNTTIFSELPSFLGDFSDTNLFPMFILGGKKGISEDDIYSSIPIGGNEDIVVLMNPYVNYYNPVTNTLMEINGYYAAAAVAGRMISLPVYSPLTKRIIYGIDSVPKITERKMNYYATRGMLVLCNRGSQVECRHGITTKTLNSATREISIVRSKHYMIRSLIDDLNNTVVGTSLDEYTILSVKSIVTSRLDALKGSKIISEYMDVKAKLNTSEPTRVDVKFKYRPSWPINYIVIQFSIDMTTGDLVGNQ